MKQDKVLVACPKCGHTQQEPAAAYSSVCKKCRQHFRLDEVLPASERSLTAPAAPRSRPQTPAAPRREVRTVTCFQCGTVLEVSPSAQSTMCKRCSSHMDLRDYQITNAVSKNFRTRGRFVIEEGGYVFNTETFAGEAIIKGRFLGKLVVEQSLEVHRSAEIKGTFSAGRLVIPAGTVFRWPDTLALGGADVAGELIANVKSTGTIVLHPGARLFGDLEARDLIVESGAVLVGRLRIGNRAAGS